MLNERKGRGVSYDPGAGTARIDVAPAGGAPTGTGGATRDSTGTALFDATGDLVGVDVEPSSASRTVVMLGQHEAVARTEPTRLTVTRDAHGEVTTVVVHGIKR